MKTRHWVLAFALVGGAAIVLFFWLARQLTPPAAAQAALDPVQARIATRFIEHLEAGRYGEAHAMFAPAAASAIDIDQLQSIWQALPQQLGGTPVRGPARGERIGDDPITTFELSFPKAALDARIGTDDAGLIDGFRLVPAQAPAAAPPPSGVSERDVEVAGLPATLALPAGDGPFPAIVLVHGSGPLDRDETIGPNRPFREIAHGLAAHGIASLRYDKRTLARPADFAGGNFTVQHETVDDAVAAVDLLRTTDGIDPARVFVVGHSLGAMLAPRIAAQRPDLAGLVLLAAPARPLDVIVPAQVRYLADLDGKRDDAELASIAQIDAAAATTRALGDQAPSGELLLGLPASYWRDLHGYDPVQHASGLDLPVLVLHGGRDYQVTDEDFEHWRQAFGDSERVTLRRYPALNHLFAAGEGPGRPDEYFEARPFAPEVIDDIAGWIDARR